MTARRRRALLVAAVVVATFPAIPPGPVAATSTAQVHCGGQLQVPDGVTNPAEPIGTVPIVMVHGITDSGALWSKPALDGGPTLAQKLGALPAASVWAFDYHAASIEWVTDPRIGPALADAITCLSRATGNKVVLIAHSMGGLAIEYAVGQDDVASQVAQISTIATPFDGSAALTAVAALLQQGEAPPLIRGLPTTAAKLILSYCTRLNREAYTANDGEGCSFAGIPGSPVGAALQVGSDEIAALPPWPADVPTFRVAGDMSLYPFGRGIFGAALDALGRPPLRVGDVAVAMESALSLRVQGPTLVVPCDATVAEMMDVRCFHSNLPMDREVIDAVYAQVEPVITNQSEPGGGGVDATADLYTRTYEFDCFDYPPTTFEETPRSAPSGPGPTQRYPLVDGRFDSEENNAVTIDMVKLDVADFDGDGATEATVLLNCDNVIDFVRDHDYLFAFEAGPDGWAPIGDPLAAWYVVNVGNGLYESYDRSSTTYEDNTYKRTVWKVDPGDPRVFVPVEHGPKVPLEQLPQDPGQFVTPCPCFPPGS